MGGADYGTVRAAAFMGLAMMSARESAAQARPPYLDNVPAASGHLPLIGAALGKNPGNMVGTYLFARLHSFSSHGCLQLCCMRSGSSAAGEPCGGTTLSIGECDQ